MGNVYSTLVQGERGQNIETAIKAYKNALLVQTKEIIPLENLKTSLYLADLLYTNQRWGEACEAFQQAHVALELMRGETLKEASRRQLARSSAKFFARLVHCCLLLEDLEAAGNYALSGKSRTLNEQLTGERQTLSELLELDPELAQEYLPLQQRRRDLDTLLAILRQQFSEDDTRNLEEVVEEREKQYSEVTALRKEINFLTDNMVFKYPALSVIQSFPPMTISDAKTLASELGNLFLVEYIQHGGGWGAFVITSQTIHYVPLADRLLEQIGQSLTMFLQNDTEGHTLFWKAADWRERLKQLYELIFKPLLHYLPESGQVVIAPTKELHLVPFQALLTEEGSFLSESYAFSFVPSLATLHVLHERSKRSEQAQSIPNRLLNVSHSGGQHNYLEHVYLEAKEVDTQFDDSIFLSEEEATLEQVIEEANSRTYQVVHFNCHGRFLANNPTHSGLLLSQH
ncbi:CHAT domain-containing protein, partial [uncultured Nostoc sp.]|uniref:CHAT domain-containing protein n=1 Tax=uncultured Nostoc sp. TaxID=340711 RepID=UPI0035CC043A